MVRLDFGREPITENEILYCRWYAVVDDLLGGWSIANVDQPTAEHDPYEGSFELGSFLAEYEAKHIVDLHNAWWDTIIWESYYDNIELSLYHDYVLSQDLPEHLI